MEEALLIAAHGSHRNPESSAPAFDHADAIRDLQTFATVRETFWKEEPSFREVLRTLHPDEVYVVPLFVSVGYFTEEVIPRELRLADWDPSSLGSDGLSASPAPCTPTDVDKTVVYCGPVGTHAAMTDVIVRRAENVTGDGHVGEGVALAVVGHGTERNENSAKAIEYHVDRLRERGRFDEVVALFMDEEPGVDDLLEYVDASRIVLVPLFIADGYHTQEDIPVDVGLVDNPASGYDVPTQVGGRTVWYAGAVGTEPLVAQVILQRAAEAGADVPESLTRTDGGDSR